MSLKKELYLKVKEQILKDLKPTVKTVRLFNNQFENESTENAFAYGAVLLEFSDIQYLAGTNGNQSGDVTLTLHVGLESLEDEDLRMFDLLDDLFRMMTDLQLGFTRTGETQDSNHDNIQVWTQSYKTTLIDDAANIHKRRETTVSVIGIDATPEIVDEIIC